MDCHVDLKICLRHIRHENLSAKTTKTCSDGSRMENIASRRTDVCVAMLGNEFRTLHLPGK